MGRSLRSSFLCGCCGADAAGEDVLDAVDFGGDVAGGEAGDFGGGGSVETFKVSKHHLAVERLELVDHGVEEVELVAMFGLVSLVVGDFSQLFEADEFAGLEAHLAADVGGGGVVGDAIDPGAEGAAAVKGFEAAPEGDVDLLEQVAAEVGVGLPGKGEAPESRAESSNSLFVAPVPVSFGDGCGVRHGLELSHIQGSPRGGRVSYNRIILEKKRKGPHRGDPLCFALRFANCVCSQFKT